MFSGVRREYAFNLPLTRNDVTEFSASHRVNPPLGHIARYSIPTFWSCDLEVPLVPIKSCVSDERPQKYEVITAGAYGKSIMDAIYMVGPGVEP
jgi:isopenicillin N synthase-like dioxygenase